MVWSKLQFEREVCRQMIELESIRKRIVPDADVLERIDRLEESHRHLLRRIDECFALTRVGAQVGAPSGASRERCPQGGCRQHRRCRRQWISKMEARARRAGEILKASPLHAHGVGSPGSPLSKGPGLGQRCGTCGKVLLSSILAGDEVIFQKKAWRHRACAEPASTYRRPHLRN
jgi:hypothetical protein